MVKGLLVVGMLVIHASNFFVASPGIHRLVYPTLLGFVSGSWLFISGYIIGLRYRLTFVANSRAIARRLFGRGWRLVAIFVVTNIVLGHLSPASCFGDAPVGGCNLVQIFILGDDRQAFEVLLGIGYVLLIAPACLWLSKRVTAGLALSLVIGLSAWERSGATLPLLAWMLACGVAGISVGSLMNPVAIRRVMDSRQGRLRVALLGLLTWVVTKALVLSGAASGDSPLFYVPHVASALCVLYVAGYWLAGIQKLRGPLTVMAHYSLLAYMGQMAILTAWHSLAGDRPVMANFPVSVVVTLCVLLGGLYALSALRNRFALVDRLYLSVFG